MLVAPFDFGQRKFLLGAVRNHVSVAGIEYAEAETIIAGNQCAARSCSIEMADGRTDHFHSFCSGQKVTQELKTSMKGKLGPRIASTIKVGQTTRITGKSARNVVCIRCNGDEPAD